MPRELRETRGRRLPQASAPPPEITHTRIEMRFAESAREIKDLEGVAYQTSGNPTRKGEAGAYIVRMWSRVIHGELSPSAFWEIFGVAPLPPPSYPMMLMPPSAPVVVPSPAPIPEPVVEDPEAAARKRQRARNREAVSEEWGG